MLHNIYASNFLINKYWWLVLWYRYLKNASWRFLWLFMMIDSQLSESTPFFRGGIRKSRFLFFRIPNISILYRFSTYGMSFKDFFLLFLLSFLLTILYQKFKKLITWPVRLCRLISKNFAFKKNKIWIFFDIYYFRTIYYGHIQRLH